MEKEVKTELEHLISSIRKENPDIIQLWVSCHIECCEKIISETEGGDQKDGSYNSVRVYCAEESKKTWKSVLEGDEYWAHINGYFLKDYEEILDRIIEAA